LTPKRSIVSPSGGSVSSADLRKSSQVTPP
jgi:hypothetical protein